MGFRRKLKKRARAISVKQVAELTAIMAQSVLALLEAEYGWQDVKRRKFAAALFWVMIDQLKERGIVKAGDMQEIVDLWTTFDEE